MNFRPLARTPRVEDETRIESLPIESILPNPYQPRRAFSQQSIDELAQSIMQFGMMQPINVRKLSARNYELIAGERRLRACKKAGFKYIQAIVQDVYEKDSAMMALIENLQRENLHFLEEASGFALLLNDHNMTQEDLAKRLGKTQSTIANKLRLLRLSDTVKSTIRQAQLSERHARALLRIPDEELQDSILQLIIDKGLSVKETESLVEQTLWQLGPEVVEAKQAPPSRKRVLKVFRDYRVFINTVRSAFQQMRESGLDGDMQMQDADGRLEIRIILQKP